MHEEDEFWDLGQAPKKAIGKVFAKDTETVTIAVGGESAAEESIPKPDEARRKRLEAARAAMLEAQDRSRGAREARKTDTAARLLREQREDDGFTLDDVPKPPKRSQSAAYLARLQAEIAEKEKKDKGKNAAVPVSSEEIPAMEVPPMPPVPPEPPVPQRPSFPSASHSAPRIRPEPIPPMGALLPTEEYKPENPLLCAVRITKWEKKYVFFDSFLRAAKRLHPLHGTPAPAAPLFDLMPHYDKLTSAQRAFYLWFREEVRGGRFPEADTAYILLYVYEIINLPDLIPPKDGVRLLCGLWANYRERNKRLDRSLTEWVCDYCLLHRVSPAFELLAPFYPEIVRGSVCKPFWIGEDKSVSSPYAAALPYAVGYDYTQSPCRSPENRAFFDRSVRAGLDAALACLSDAGESALSELGLAGMRPTVLCRDTFSGAVCTYEQKFRLEVDALQILHSFEFRSAVTDLVKYTENHVRALLGIRSRFHTHVPDGRLKSAVDAYFAPLDGRRKEEKKTAAPAPPPPAYEQFYEPASTGLSPELAAEIEQAAWKTTRLLTEEDEYYEEETEPAASAPEVPAKGGEETAAADPVAEGFDALLRQDNAAFLAAAKRAGLLPDTLAEQCNECALDLLGDTAVGSDGSTYSLLPDYKEEIAEWMKTRSRNGS